LGAYNDSATAFGGSIASTPARLISNYGVSSLLRGVIPTCGRESIFTMGMLGICPVLNQFLQDSGLNEATALSVGALTGAITSATLTHPLDTIKTCMQGDAGQETYTNIRGTGAILMEQSGSVSGLFKGLGWRIGLISTTFFIINGLKPRIAKLMFPKYFDEED